MPNRRITPTKRAQVFRDNEGICYLCTRKIAHGEAWDVEHITPKALGGTDDAPNLKPAHKDCHKPKTANDVKSIRKADRAGKKHAGIKSPSKWQTGRSSRFKKRLDGTVVDRKTGEPV